jgi:cell division protein FtsB
MEEELLEQISDLKAERDALLEEIAKLESNS